MSEVKNMPILAKTSVTSNDYIAVTGLRRLQLMTLFPSLSTTGSGGESLYTGITNANQLNFKGIISGTPSMLALSTVSDNVQVSVLPAGIDLSLCDNTTSQFLSSVDLTSDVTGTLPVNRGGTGISTILKGAILFASDDGVIGGTSVLGNGQLLIGNAVTGVPTVASLTAGANVTVTNGPGTVTIAANLSTLAAVLNCDIYNINLNAAAGPSWLSGDGTSEGVYVDSSGRVFIGDSLPTLPSLSGQLTLGGISTDALRIGNTSSYGNRRIKMVDSSAAASGADLTIEGANGGTGSQNGGNLIVQAGAGSGSGTGGIAGILGGNTSTGDSGEAFLGNIRGASVRKGFVVNAAGDSLINRPARFTFAPLTVTGPGAIDYRTQIVHLETTGADAFTLGDGEQGSMLIITMTVDGGDGTLTPANLAGGTTITFSDVGDTVHLLFTNSNWVIMGIHGATVA